MSDGRPRPCHVGGASPYDVVVGRDLLDRLPGVLGDGVRAGRARASRARSGDLAQRVRTVLRDRDVLRHRACPTARRPRPRRRSPRLLGGARPGRRSPAPTPSSPLGGGATTDLGGFVAATWLRGVRVVHVPTTPARRWSTPPSAARPASTPRAGKNLVGSFHEPAGVLCDLALLDTLPARGAGRRPRRGRQVRLHRRPRDPRPRREHRPGRARPRTRPCSRELVERAIRVKIDVVVGRPRRPAERRRPGREVLNYGHTMAHAIERASDYAVRHGEAVAIGMVYVAELARLAGRARRRHRRAAPRGLRARRAADALVRRVVRGAARGDGAWTRRRAAASCGSSCSTGSARRRC